MRRREYRRLILEKRNAFWRIKIDSERSDPRQLWRSVSSLVSRGRAPVSMPVGADETHWFFDDKVAGVRASTDDVPPPAYTLLCVNHCTDDLSTR